MSEQVEWRVMYEDEHGAWHNAQDGAQSIFGLTSAKKLAERLGPPFSLFHRRSMLPPAEHELWEAEQRKAEEKPQTFGSQWAP